MGGGHEPIRIRKKLGTNPISEFTEENKIAEVTEQAEPLKKEVVEMLEEKISVPLRGRYEPIHKRKKRGVGFVEAVSSGRWGHKENARAAIAEVEDIIKELWENHKEAIETLGRAKISFESGNFEKALSHANSAKLLASNSKKAFAS